MFCTPLTWQEQENFLYKLYTRKKSQGKSKRMKDAGFVTYVTINA